MDVDRRGHIGARKHAIELTVAWMLTPPQCDRGSGTYSVTATEKRAAGLLELSIEDAMQRIERVCPIFFVNMGSTQPKARCNACLGIRIPCSVDPIQSAVATGDAAG